VLTLVAFFTLLTFGVGLQAPAVSIGSSDTSIESSGIVGTIADKRGYICGNYNSTHYYAQNNSTGEYELISTDAVQTINYALSKLTPGRTWQETILLKGDFSIGRTVTLNQGKALLDCRQATLTLTVSTILISVTGGGGYTFLGGHFIGPNTGSTNNIAFRFVNCFNCLIDGANIEGFPGNNGGILVIGYGTSEMVVQNCNFHDNTNSQSINLLNAGYNKVINCIFANPSQGIFVKDHCSHNQITGCEFYGWHQGGYGHAIYLDGNDGSDANTNEGYNVVSGCTFHDPLAYAAFQVKCHHNSFYNNTLYNFNSASVGFAIWSEYTSCTSNDNEIYNNTLRDMVAGINIGHGNNCKSPTDRTKIHDNVFTQVTKCIQLNPVGYDNGPSTSHVDDTWIYHNTFYSCGGNPFPATDSDGSTLIVNTVIAYNTFSQTVTGLSVESYKNTMVYGNIGMADFNVPYPLPIPPP
jgi:hypothetical protein